MALMPSSGQMFLRQQAQKQAEAAAAAEQAAAQAEADKQYESDVEAAKLRASSRREHARLANLALKHARDRERRDRMEESRDRVNGREESEEGGYVGGVVPTSGEPTPEELAGRSDRISFTSVIVESPSGETRVYTPSGELVADYAPSERPGYYPEESTGDAATDRIMHGMELLNRYTGIPVPTRAEVLEMQRQQAYDTPGTKDDQFFRNELEKLNRNQIEMASEYHDLGMQLGIPISPNPHENAADLALALEKGGNKKDDLARNYAFNPEVGALLGDLPGGQGLQEYGWAMAKAVEKNTPLPTKVSFMAAIQRVERAKGRMGVYGALGSRAPDLIDKRVTESAEPIAATEHFKTILGEGKDFDTTYNELVAHYESELAAYEQGGSKDRGTYEDLVAERRFLQPLGIVKGGLDTFRASVVPQMEEGVTESREPNYTPARTWYVFEDLFKNIPGMSVYYGRKNVESQQRGFYELYDEYSRLGLIQNNTFKGTDRQYNNLVSTQALAEAAQKKQQELEAPLTVSQSQLVTLPIATWSLETFAKIQQGTTDAMNLAEEQLPPDAWLGKPIIHVAGGVGEFVLGLPPYMLLLIPAAETLVRNPTAIGAGMIPGTVSLVEGMSALAREDPFRFSGNIIGMKYAGDVYQKSFRYTGRYTGLVKEQVWFPERAVPELGAQPLPYQSGAGTLEYILETPRGPAVRTVSRPYGLSIPVKPGEMVGELPTYGTESLYVNIPKSGEVYPTGTMFQSSWKTKGNWLRIPRNLGSSLVSTITRPRTYLFEDIAHVQLPEPLKNAVYESVRKTGNFAKQYQEILTLAREQSAETGRPVLAPSPKMAMYGEGYTGLLEPEGLLVFGSESSKKLGLPILGTARSFSGMTSKGIGIVTKINYRPTETGFNTDVMSEARYWYDWYSKPESVGDAIREMTFGVGDETALTDRYMIESTGIGEGGTFTREKIVKSLGSETQIPWYIENLQWNLEMGERLHKMQMGDVLRSYNEQFGNALSFKEWELTGHGPEHSAHVAGLLARMQAAEPNRIRERQEVLYAAARLHDVAKLSAGETEPLGHAAATAAAIRENIIDLSTWGLSREESLRVADMISQHERIQPFTLRTVFSGDIGRAIATQTIWRPSVEEMALATADRLALRRFGIIPRAGKMWEFEAFPETSRGSFFPRLPRTVTGGTPVTFMAFDLEAPVKSVFTAADQAKFAELDAAYRQAMREIAYTKNLPKQKGCCLAYVRTLQYAANPRPVVLVNSSYEGSSYRQKYALYNRGHEYAPVYGPDYALVYGPRYKPAYGPRYQPSYGPEYAPEYGPEYVPDYGPRYKPDYSPRYQPDYGPEYAPDYGPDYAPDYGPAYTPTYAPRYQPRYKPPVKPYKYAFRSIKMLPYSVAPAGRPERERKRRHGKYDVENWYIYNPTPTYETIFGYQLNIREGSSTQKMSLPKIKMPKMNLKKYGM